MTPAQRTKMYNTLLKRAKKRGIVIVSKAPLTEGLDARVYIYDLNLCKQVSPTFKNVSDCIDLLELYL